MAERPRVCVLGLGYIGLPTSSILATHGFSVAGVDVDPGVIRSLAGGKIHIEEPGLQAMVQAAIHSGRLTLHSQPQPADVFILAVPTPGGADHGMDPAYVRAAAEAILPVLEEGNLVILESTVRPGTSAEVICPLLEEAGWQLGENLFYAHCPERVMPGRVLREFIQNHRILGADDPVSFEKACAVYGPVVEGELHQTSVISAELCKLYENTYRDVNIALVNEAARVCVELGANVHDVIRLANLHPRVQLHQPGPGVGGHCISVDPRFLAARCPDTTKLVQLARSINDAQPAWVARQVGELLRGVEAPKVAVLGVAYKGNVDDVRETPAMGVLLALEEQGVTFAVHDPHVRAFRWECHGIRGALAGAHLVLVLAAHDEFRYLDPQALLGDLDRPMILDCCESVDHDKWGRAGFEVYRLGVAPQTVP